MKPHSDRRVPRRAVAKGAAWMLPVVAFAEAAPAASASTTNQVCSVTVTAAGVKHKGKTVTLTFSAQNAGAAAETVSFVSIVGPANAKWSGPSPSNWPASPGASTQHVTLSRGNNAKGTATVTLLVCGKNVTLSVGITT